MRYCQECAAEVQPTDTFCSYCGVALQPFLSAPENAISKPLEQAVTVEEETETKSAEEVANAFDEQNKEQNVVGGSNFNAPNIEQPQIANEEQRIDEPEISVRSNISEITVKSYSGLELPQIEQAETPIETVDEFDVEPQTVVRQADNAPIETDTQTSAVDSSESKKDANETNEAKAVNKDFVPISTVEPFVAKSVEAQTDDNDEFDYEPQTVVRKSANVENKQLTWTETASDDSNEEPETIISSNNEEPETVVSSTPFIPKIEPRDLHQTENPLQIGELNASAFDYDREFGDEPFELSVREDSKDLHKSDSPEIVGEPKKSANDYDEDLPPTLIGHNFDFAEAKALKQNLANAPDVVENADDIVNKEFSGEDSLSDFSLKDVDVSAVDKSAESDLTKNSFGFSSGNDSPLGTLSGKKAEIERKPPRQTDANRLAETPSDKNSKLKPLIEGTVLNRRYEIVRRIGGGGMGAVYLASDHNLGGVLRAVKEMIQAYVDESQQEKAVQDFRRESLLLTSLEHPAIPTIYDYFYDENNGRFYLVMKYISGGDLSARLRSAPNGKIDERNITEWAIQIADVLDYLHNRQPSIVYRDLKPANVMLDGNTGRAMLIDFGIARWVNKEEKGVTAVGTMGYAPPELFSGNAEPRSDIYSLGATMFHLLTGADPQSQPLLIFDFTKNPKPRAINPELSAEMEEILCRAVEYNSALRFSSAAEMREVLLIHLDKLRGGKLTFPQQVANNANAATTKTAQTITSQAFCSSCGKKIMLTDVFCPFCGAQQPASQRAVGQQLNSIASTVIGKVTAKLIVLGTAELNAPSFVLEKDTNLVGREDRRSNIFPEIDLTKYDGQAKISRRHARIWREGAKFMVEDLKSSNGTTVISNDEKNVRLEPFQPRVLSSGDKVKIGETTLHFFIE